MRVGILGLQHESNTFVKTPTTLDSFRSCDLLTGEAVRTMYAPSHHELGGFLAGLAEASIEPVPVFAARALPSGAITAEACDQLVALMLEAIDRTGPLDGWLVAPHGAAVGAIERDFDGHWLSWVRDKVGADVPVIGTLDPHANVSARMVAACNALIAYRSNPHLDQKERGLEAARLMARTLRGEVRPTLAASLPPVSINIERQLTAASPCRELYALADGQLSTPVVLSNSVVLGFPYADVAEMGSGCLVVTDGDRPLAQRLADALGSYLWEHRREFIGQLVGIDDAVRQAATLPGPVGLLEMGDNVGGGSPGDGTWLLDAAIRAGVSAVFACLYDPEAVAGAEQTGKGGRVTLALGGKTDREHGPTLHETVTVASLHDGQFAEREPRHGGQTRYDMGRTALVRLEGGQTVMLTSRRMTPFSLSQLTTFGVQPAEFQAIVIKGVHAPVAAYAPVCRHLIRVDTPGATRADMTKLEFRHRRRPLFPFEDA